MTLGLHDLYFEGLEISLNQQQKEPAYTGIHQNGNNYYHKPI